MNIPRLDVLLLILNETEMFNLKRQVARIQIFLLSDRTIERFFFCRQKFMQLSSVGTW